jgi:hypothetical protein
VYRPVTRYEAGAANFPMTIPWKVSLGYSKSSSALPPQPLTFSYNSFTRYVSRGGDFHFEHAVRFLNSYPSAAAEGGCFSHSAGVSTQGQKGPFPMVPGGLLGPWLSS